MSRDPTNESAARASAEWRDGDSACEWRGARLRLAALAVFLASGSVLAVAAWLHPDRRGHGTHEQLGMGACSMMVVSGLPCPTCGMTTAFAHTVRGELISAAVVQPGGLVLAIATIVAAVASLYALVVGRLPKLWVLMVSPYRLFVSLLVVLLGGWAYKLVVVILSKPV